MPVKPKRLLTTLRVIVALAVILAGTVVFLKSRQPPQEFDTPAVPTVASAEDQSSDISRSGESGDPPNRAAPTTLGSSAGVEVADEGHVLVLRFVDEGSRPVSGVEVVSNDPSDEGPVLATSASDGEALMPHLSGPQVLRTFAPGFADELIRVPDSPQSPRIVHLRREACISGRVLLASGRPAVGAIVLAWPRTLGGERPDRFAGVRASRGDRRSQCVETGADGSFVVCGLQSGMRYGLASGADGRACEEQTVVAPRSDVIFTLEDAFCCLVALVDGDGALASQDPRLDPSGDYHVAAKCPVEGSRCVRVSASALLAGFPSDQLQHPPGTSLWLYTCSGRSEPTLPVNLSVKLLGFRPVEREVLLPRLSSELCVRTIPLVQDAAGKGQVVLTFVSDSSQVRSEPVSGYVVLRGSEPSDIRLSVEAARGSEQSFEVPRGTYTCRFVARMGRFAFPGLEHAPVLLQVGDSPAVFQAKVPEVGSLEIQLEPEASAGWVERLSCTLSAPLAATADGGARMGAVSTVDVQGPPFRIHGLVAGTYSAIVGGVPSANSTIDTVLIEGGKTAVLKVTVRRDE